MSAGEWLELLDVLGCGAAAGLLLILAGAITPPRPHNSRTGKDDPA
ncbi:hypothetical protein [Streptomyces swartbergensis]|nr:hypothetical protein [Streptomyces swartbergensis]